MYSIQQNLGLAWFFDWSVPFDLLVGCWSFLLSVKYCIEIDYMFNCFLAENFAGIRGPIFTTSLHHASLHETRTVIQDTPYIPGN